jgi:tetratricopeptide (TPR) repeat protein
MTENAPHELEQEVPDACFQCNSPDYEPNYQVKLCKTCRKRFSRYPLKKNILLGAIGLGLLFVFSIYRFIYHYPSALSYEKGVDFADKREFVSAENAFRTTLASFPENDASKAHILKAYYYNNKMDAALEIGKELDQNTALRYRRDLAEEVADINELLAKNQAQHPDVNTAQAYLKDNRWGEADSLLSKIVRDNPTNWEASLLLSTCLRQEKKYNDALSLCNQMLSYNHQFPAALAEKSTVLLMLKQNNAAH